MGATYEHDAAQRDAVGERAVFPGEHTTLSPGWMARLLGDVEDTATPLPLLPFAQQSGPPAGLARWVGIAVRCQAIHDAVSERSACRWIATHLADADQDFAEAFAYASRAANPDVHDGWSMQHSRWLEHVGLHEKAANVLATGLMHVVTGQEAGRLLVRIARLQTKANHPSEAINNLLEAATVWPTYAGALEKAGELAASQRMASAVDMFLEAADRHEHNGNATRAFDSRRRALEANPCSESACESLAAMLDNADRSEAADAVRATYASHCAQDRALPVHLTRLARGRETGDVGRVLASIIDGQLEALESGSHVTRVDDGLAAAGLPEALAARWEWMASRCQSAERARHLLAVAQLYENVLDCPYRATEALIDALAADPQSEQAYDLLANDKLAAYDPTALAEALIRAALHHPDPLVARHSLAQLAEVAQQRLVDPGLAHWALTQLRARGLNDETVDRNLESLLPRLRIQNTALRQAVDGNTATESRVDDLRRLTVILRGRPDEVNQYIDALGKLLRLRPQERRLWIDLCRVCVRTGRLSLLEDAANERFQLGASGDDTMFLRSMLVTQGWRLGNLQAVIRHSMAMGELPPTPRMAPCHLWLASTIQQLPLLRVQALEQLAPHLPSKLQAVVLATTARLLRALEQRDKAKQLAHQAVTVSPDCTQALLALADTYRGDISEQTPAVIEKLAGRCLPTSAHYRDTVRSLRHHGDNEQAHLWASQWLALRPWDFEVFETLVRTACECSQTSTLSSCLLLATSLPVPFSRLEPLLCEGLTTLLERDLSRAKHVAQELCDHFGVRHTTWRQTLLQVAKGCSDRRFYARVIERWLADPSAVDADQQAELWVELHHLYGTLGDQEAAARSLVRAVTSGYSPSHVLELTQTPAANVSADTFLYLIEARARAYEALKRATPNDDVCDEHARSHWLTLGAARWMRAQDPVGAVSAWLAVFGRSADGFAQLVQCLAHSESMELACEALRLFAMQCDDPSTQACALVVAAASAVALKQTSTALQLALDTLAVDGRRTDALMVVDRAALQETAAEAVDRAHWLAAQGAKGRFGRKSAHLRACRALETRGYPLLAMPHALAAFEADPVQGAALEAMMRMAKSTDPTPALTALSRMAQQAEQAAETSSANAGHLAGMSVNQQSVSSWWMLASQIAALHASHAAQAVEFACRALVLQPSASDMQRLGELMDQLLARHSTERSTQLAHMSRLYEHLKPQLEGPVGARIALAAASICAVTLSAAELAMAWANLALTCSGDIDEYETLVSHAEHFAGDVAGCHTFLDEVLAREKSVSGTTGQALFTFAQALTSALSDTRRHDALERMHERLRLHDDLRSVDLET